MDSVLADAKQFGRSNDERTKEYPKIFGIIAARESSLPKHSSSSSSNLSGWFRKTKSLKKSSPLQHNSAPGRFTDEETCTPSTVTAKTDLTGASSAMERMRGFACGITEEPEWRCREKKSPFLLERQFTRYKAENQLNEHAGSPETFQEEEMPRWGTRRLDLVSDPLSDVDSVFSKSAALSPSERLVKTGDSNGETKNKRTKRRRSPSISSLSTNQWELNADDWSEMGGMSRHSGSIDAPTGLDCAHDDDGHVDACNGFLAREPHDSAEFQVKPRLDHRHHPSSPYLKDNQEEDLAGGAAPPPYCFVQAARFQPSLGTKVDMSQSLYFTYLQTPKAPSRLALDSLKNAKVLTFMTLSLKSSTKSLKLMPIEESMPVDDDNDSVSHLSTVEKAETTTRLPTSSNPDSVDETRKKNLLRRAILVLSLISIGTAFGIGVFFLVWRAS